MVVMGVDMWDTLGLRRRFVWVSGGDSSGVAKLDTTGTVIVTTATGCATIVATPGCVVKCALTCVHLASKVCKDAALFTLR